MANKTRIEWCDLTINPIIGCTKCSLGCDNCYAEKMAMRLSRHTSAAGERYRNVVHFSPHDGHGEWNGETDVDFSCFDHLPKKPSRIFVGSMGDVFHESVFDDKICEVVRYARRFHEHTFMFLTKRPERMRKIFREINGENIWAGVTVCNQAEADEKIPILLSTPSAKRFVSVEPMLGEINFRWTSYFADSQREYRQYLEKNGHIGELESLKFLDWVICGGETGRGARTMDEAWARLLRDQCKDAEVPFFFKKMSGNAPIPADLMVREAPE